MLALARARREGDSGSSGSASFSTVSGAQMRLNVVLFCFFHHSLTISWSCLLCFKEKYAASESKRAQRSADSPILPTEIPSGTQRFPKDLNKPSQRSHWPGLLLGGTELLESSPNPSQNELPCALKKGA